MSLAFRLFLASALYYVWAVVKTVFMKRHIKKLEEEMATHSSILVWGIPWTEEPGRLQSMGSQELDMTEGLTTTT